MKKNIRRCRVSGCPEDPYLGGLCKAHHEKDAVHDRRRDAAVHALHTAMINDRLPDDPTLREELFQLREWWNRACLAVQAQRSGHLMPLDEAEYALEWSISLAQEIVDAEIAVRNGRPVGKSLDATRDWVWGRFRNLEAGLQSNGVPRRIGR
jgi:choline dehydrogenase-like flavoprotein